MSERERERENISERSGAWQKPHAFRMQNKVHPQTHIQERQTGSASSSMGALEG